MKHDDPRITAYALGELHGQDKMDFDKELQKHPEIQTEIDTEVAASFISLQSFYHEKYENEAIIY